MNKPFRSRSPGRLVSGSLLALFLLISPARAQEAPPPAVELALSPAAPTSADLIEVELGGGGPRRRALRAGNVFFVESLQVPARATYTLGALPPGEYSFRLYQQVPGALFCRHDLLGEVRFSVAEPPASGASGLILLLLSTDSAQQAQALVRRESPTADWLFGKLAALSFLPGLEGTYAELLRPRAEVQSVDFNSVAFIPECPPPLGSAIAPGSVLISFKEEVERAAADALLDRLPPTLARWASLRVLVEDHPPASTRARLRSAAWVRVPPGWEALFLRRYLRHPEVQGGSVLRAAAWAGTFPTGGGLSAVQGWEAAGETAGHIPHSITLRRL